MSRDTEKEKEPASEDKVVLIVLLLGSAAAFNTKKKWSGKSNGHKSFTPQDNLVG